jgi:steroid 5-alpha reductase family enzyme
LITLWAIRLTFNFWRKGGYGNLITHEEDYRWPILRKQMSPLVFLLFNLTFIASYQNILLFLIVLPLQGILENESQRTLTSQDFLLAAAFLLFLAIETIADEQHFVFQTKKHALSAEARNKHANADIRRGFLTAGLFAFSRHPNYFAEQSMWVVVYLFTVTVQQPWHYSVIGCLQLIALFQGSMQFGESITTGKYPQYKLYQKVTSQCIPWFSGVKSLPNPDQVTAAPDGKAVKKGGKGH